PTPGRASVPTRRSSDLVAVADRLLELDDHFPGPVGAPAPLRDADGGHTVDVVGTERKPVADEVDDDRERGEKCKNADRAIHLPSLGVGPSRVNDAHAMYQEKRQASAGGKHCESEERPRLGQPARRVLREGSGDESDRVDEGVSQDRREQRSGAYARDAGGGDQSAYCTSKSPRLATQSAPAAAATKSAVRERMGLSPRPAGRGTRTAARARSPGATRANSEIRSAGRNPKVKA